jgi:Alpha/beta hydrolase family
MATKDVGVVLTHGAWAHGLSWTRVITSLKAHAVEVFAAPLPLTSLAADVVALNRSLDRTEGPIVLAGHAYAGAVIALARPERCKRSCSRRRREGRRRVLSLGTASSLSLSMQLPMIKPCSRPRSDRYR